MNNLKYIITGTGRCGTVYGARFLTSLGIPCGHESVFNFEGIDVAKERIANKSKRVLSIASLTDYNMGNPVALNPWVDVDEIVADSSYMAAPFLSEFEDVQVIHFVRHPLRVINSFCNYIDYFKSEVPANIYESYIYSHLPQLKEKMPVYDRCALYYILWNRQIKSDFLHKIEDSKQGLLNFLGRKNESHFSKTYVNTYARPSNKFVIKDIESEVIKSDLVELGEEYGYIMEEDVIVF